MIFPTADNSSNASPGFPHAPLRVDEVYVSGEGEWIKTLDSQVFCAAKTFLANPDNMDLVLPKSFSAKLQKSPNIGGWTYVVWSQSAKVFGTKGLVKITGKIDGLPFRASFMAMGDGQHMLPIKAETRKAIGKDVGETVKVVIEARL